MEICCLKISSVDGTTRRQIILKDQLITVGDLELFKEALKREMLLAFRELLFEQPQKPPKRWLKSHQVEELLDLKPNTVQALRDNGELPFSKLGGTYYYDPEDIDNELQKRKGYGRYRNGKYLTNDRGRRD